MEQAARTFVRKVCLAFVSSGVSHCRFCAAHTSTRHVGADGTRAAARQRQASNSSTVQAPSPVAVLRSIRLCTKKIVTDRVGESERYVADQLSSAHAGGFKSDVIPVTVLVHVR